MGRIRKSILWVLTGIVVGLLALSIIGGQALAEAPPPSTAGEVIGAGINMNSAHFGLNWDVIGTGGGKMSSAHFLVNSTIGQPTVGTVDSDHFEVCTGYWCWLKRLSTIFLPLVLRN